MLEALLICIVLGQAVTAAAIWLLADKVRRIRPPARPWPPMPMVPTTAIHSSTKRR